MRKRQSLSEEAVKSSQARGTVRPPLITQTLVYPPLGREAQPAGGAAASESLMHRRVEDSPHIQAAKPQSH